MTDARVEHNNANVNIATKQVDVDLNIDLIVEEMPGPAGDNKSLRKQLEEDAWVQCENHKCLKWRRLPVEVANHLGDEPWYCWFNPDTAHNSCGAPEQDYHTFEKAVSTSGLCYIISVLSEGTIVWARMPGYCRWPALVTPDPIYIQSVSRDHLGNAMSYHLEYLGQPRSHSWLSNRFIEPYSQPKDQSSQASTDDDCRRSKRCGKGKSSKFNMFSTKKSSYKKASVQNAVEEAEHLATLPHEKRLETCTFKYKEPEPHIEPTTFVEELPVNDETTAVQAQEHQTGEDEVMDCESAGQVQEKSKKNKKKERREKKVSSQSKDDGSWNQNLDQSTSMVGRSKEETLTLDIQMYKKNEDAFEHDLRRFMARNGLEVSVKEPSWQGTPVTLFQLFLAVHGRGGFDMVRKNKGSWQGVYDELTNTSTGTGGSIVRKYYKKNLLFYETYLTNGMKDMEIEKQLEELQIPDIVSCTKPQKKAKRQSETTGNGEKSQKKPKLPKVDKSMKSVKKAASPDVDISMNTTCPDVTSSCNAETKCPATQVVVESKEKKKPKKRLGMRPVMKKTSNANQSDNAAKNVAQKDPVNSAIVAEHLDEIFNEIDKYSAQCVLPSETPWTPAGDSKGGVNVTFYDESPERLASQRSVKLTDIAAEFEDKSKLDTNCDPDDSNQEEGGSDLHVMDQIEELAAMDIEQNWL